ncbi:MAG TPA: hypothetical protein DCF68_03400 [Cyanothece sp. UBA12306]|nr:hypothetical protein [Cyanothece sp. UBA12306]
MIQTSKKIYSFENYCNSSDESDNRYELVDGSLILMNSPTLRHFLLAKFLEEGLYEETVYLKADQLISRLFPDLELTVNQVLVSGNLNN